MDVKEVFPNSFSPVASPQPKLFQKSWLSFLTTFLATALTLFCHKKRKKSLDWSASIELEGHSVFDILLLHLSLSTAFQRGPFPQSGKEGRRGLVKSIIKKKCRGGGYICHGILTALRTNDLWTTLCGLFSFPPEAARSPRCMFCLSFRAVRRTDERRQPTHPHIDGDQEKKHVEPS